MAKDKKPKKPDFNIQTQQLLDANIKAQKETKSFFEDIMKSNLAIIKMEEDKLDLQEKGYNVKKATYKITVDGVKREVSLNRALEQQKKQKNDLLRQEKILLGHRVDYEKHLVDVQKKQIEIAKQVQQRDILQIKMLQAQKENKKATDEEIKQYKQLNDQIKENKKELEKGRELAELIKKEKKEELNDEEKANLNYLKAEKEKIKVVKLRVAYEKELQAIKAGGGKVTDDQIAKHKDLMALEDKAQKKVTVATKAHMKHSQEYKKILDDIAQNPIGASIARGVASGLAMFGTGKILKDAWGRSIKSYQTSIKGLMIDYTTASGTNIEDNAVATAKALGASRKEFIKMGYSGDQAVETYTMLQQTLRGAKSAAEIGRITANVSFLSHALHMTREEVVRFQTDMENSMGMSREESEAALVGIQMSAEKLIDTLKDGSINGKDFTKTLMSVVDAAPGYNKNVKLMAATTGNLIAKAKEYGATSKEAMDIAQKGMGMLTGNAPEWIQIQASMNLMDILGGATDVASMEAAGLGTSSEGMSKYLQFAQKQGLSEYEIAKTVGAMGSGTTAGMKSTFNVLQKTLKEQGGSGAQAVMSQQMGLDFNTSAKLLPAILEGSFEDFTKGYDEMKPTDTVDELKKSNEHLSNLASVSGENSITQKLGAIFESMHEFLSPLFIPIIEGLNMFLDHDVGKVLVMGMTGIVGLVGIWKAFELIGLASKTIQAAHLAHDVTHDAKEDIIGKGGILGKIGEKLGGLGKFIAPLAKIVAPALIAYTAVKTATAIAAPEQKERDDRTLHNEMVTALNKSGGNMVKFSQSMKGIKEYWGKDTSVSFLGIKQQLTTQYSEKEVDVKMKTMLKEAKLDKDYSRSQENLSKAALALSAEGGFTQYQEVGKGVGKFKTDKERAAAYIQSSGMSDSDIAKLAERGTEYQKNIGAWQSLKTGGYADIYTESILSRKGVEKDIIASFKGEQKKQYEQSSDFMKKEMLREQTMNVMQSEILTGKLTEEETLQDIYKSLINQEKIAKKSEKLLDEANMIAGGSLDIGTMGAEDLALEQYETLINIGSTLQNVIDKFTGSLSLGSPASKVKEKTEGKTKINVTKVKHNANGSITTTELTETEKTYPAGFIIPRVA